MCFTRWPLPRFCYSDRVQACWKSAQWWFSGIPLAVLFSEAHFHLINFIGKKIRVASEVSIAIGLKNITLHHCRSENEKEKFDFVVSRAVMPLNDLVKMVQKNITTKQINALPNGLICLKGKQLEHEILPFRKDVSVYDLSDYFTETFFETKKKESICRYTVK